MSLHSPKFVALALACALALAPAHAQLPTLGDGSDMSAVAERRLGERIARELYRDPDYIDDPVLVEYVQSLWVPLLQAARDRGDLTAELDERFGWQVLLGKDRTINAFALPGGWFGLHMGLIAATATRDELASVLAHELSHVTQRHISRLISQQNKTAPLVMAGILLGAIAAGKSADAANAVVAGTQALAMQNQLNFSRDMEREADRVGLGVMVQAGFEPQGFVAMFEKLQQASRLNDAGNYPYLRTHPMTTERVAEMQSRQQMGARPGPAAAPTLDHALASARARVIANAGVDALRGFTAEVEASSFQALPAVRQAAALYAAAFAGIRQRDTAASQRWLARLKPLVAADGKSARLARLLEAEVALAAGDAARALGVLGAPTGSRPEALLLAQAQLETGRASEAAQALQTWVATRPRDAAAWQLLARAYNAQSQPLRAVRAEAEAHVATLDYAAAMDRFKAAQDMARRGTGAGDHIEASIIDTRARAVESLLREQALER
jgi:predicted Zn-dependent protease